MNFRQMKTDEIALILHGLRAIYVSDQEQTRAKLILACEGALAARGMALAETMAEHEDPAPAPDAERAENERLRAALTKINVGDGWAAQIARAALAATETSHD